MEIFKSIPEYSSYIAGSLGTIKKSDGTILKQTTQKAGYCVVKVKHDDGRWVVRSVHRLVCLAFHPNPENKSDVNHIDADKSNNCSDNLEWATRQENMTHAKENKLYNPNLGELHQHSKLSNANANEIVKMSNNGTSQVVVA